MNRWTSCLVGALAGVALAAGPAIAAEEAGPQVGVPIPDLSALDQTGKKRSFDDLRGPKGLLVLFHRSADW